MIDYKDGQYLINGKPVLIMAGEIHYYRLDPAVSVWQERLDQLKSTGMNTVSTYIPWICHESIEGRVDIDGTYNP